jgi:hypothetical protein
MRQQATKANTAQIELHVKRQKEGLPSDWESDHPFIAALIGVSVLALSIGLIVATWVSAGAGL